MNIFKWIWEKISNNFISFVKEAVGKLTQKLIVELKEFAYDIVRDLSIKDLTDTEKRNQAFKKIKDEAIQKGIAYKDSAIYLLVELAYQKLKGDS